MEEQKPRRRDGPLARRNRKRRHGCVRVCVCTYEGVTSTLCTKLHDSLCIRVNADTEFMVERPAIGVTRAPLRSAGKRHEKGKEKSSAGMVEHAEETANGSG